MTLFAYTQPAEMPISTHTLTWSVTPPSAQAIASRTISTHTLTWSVTAAAVIPFETFADFNSHAHVERDYKILGSYAKKDISTHTLTWSVTTFFRTPQASLKISTHTLTWSVTQGIREFFNCSAISTHTLTWSVTYLMIFCET